MARKKEYPFIRFLIGSLYVLSLLLLIGGLAAGGYLWFRAEALREGMLPSGPLAGTLSAFTSDQLCLAAAVSGGGGLVGFLLFGAFAQMLAMQRHRALNSALQVQLLEDILELNEEVATASHDSRVELCEGCGRLGSLQRIESGQWICRECRRQLRSA